MRDPSPLVPCEVVLIVVFAISMVNSIDRRTSSKITVIRGSVSARGQSLPGRASSNSGHVRYAPKEEESSLPVICPCGLMATHMTSFPRSNLLKGGKVPVSTRITLALWHLERFLPSKGSQGVSVGGVVLALRDR